MKGKHEPYTLPSRSDTMRTSQNLSKSMAAQPHCRKPKQSATKGKKARHTTWAKKT
jgi:hypothetical protein